MGDLVGEADTLAALLEPRITIDNELLAPPEKVEGDNMNSVDSHSAATDSELSQVPGEADTLAALMSVYIMLSVGGPYTS